MKNPGDEGTGTDTDTAADRVRLPYVKPALTTFGPLAELTRAVGFSAMNDTQPNMKTGA